MALAFSFIYFVLAALCMFALLGFKSLFWLYCSHSLPNPVHVRCAAHVHFF
jgi:hypothetical protein